MTGDIIVQRGTEKRAVDEELERDWFFGGKDCIDETRESIATKCWKIVGTSVLKIPEFHLQVLIRMGPVFSGREISV